ncbi:uncharacterized protein LOC117317163 isoform X2 [Pecten maximus]|uniref:uncharacterized protein LOC117317163 isoform X2 n=1 Tax=Pecten maximus TaxID=6579 RepID=UPI001458A98E|nr:uncharacterized protein LOC117317163 isoform X2 [Pecten maximus]
MDYRGFITYTLCVFLFALSLCLSDVLETTVEDEDTDVPDHSFPSWTMVHNKNVTCGTIKPGLKFPSQTWTCADARNLLHVHVLINFWLLMLGLERQTTTLQNKPVCWAWNARPPHFKTNQFAGLGTPDHHTSKQTSLRMHNAEIFQQ